MSGDRAMAQEAAGMVLALDVGGTFIKSGIWDGTSLLELPPLAVDSQGGREGILASFSEAVLAALRLGPVSGLGICIPGPFDYRLGISLMTHKFAAIHGLDLAAEIRRATGCGQVPIRFRHDAVSFLAGELRCGGGRRGRILGVTLGTGIGVAACLDGVMELDPLGKPAAGISIWSRPFRGATVEDVVSARAIIARYCAMDAGFDRSRGVRGIAEAARSGDALALDALAGFGGDLGFALGNHARDLGVGLIILGGQIAKAFDLFGPALLGCVGDGIELRPSRLGDRATLLGAIEGFLPAGT